MRLAVLLSAALLVGCCSGRDAAPDTIALSKNIAHGGWFWQIEAARRFDRPVIVIVHGTTRNGTWTAVPDDGPAMPVESMARLLKQIYPRRPLVFIVCNEGRHELKVPGTYYGHGIVWSIPRCGRTGTDRIEEFYGGE